MKKHVVDYLRDETKSFEYTKKIIIDLQSQIGDEIKDLGGNLPLEKALKSLALKEED